MNNNFNNQGNAPVGGFGTAPDSNLNINQNTTPATSQPASAVNPYGSNDGFNPAVNYTGTQQSFDPKANYTGTQQLFASEQTGSSGTDFFNPVNNNQNMQQNQNVQLGEDKGKRKAVASLVLGIVSSALLFLCSLFLFWGYLFSVASQEISREILEDVSFIVAAVVPLTAMTIGVIGIVLGALYLKNAKITGVNTHKTTSIFGIILSSVGVLLSMIAAFSCLACVSCNTVMASHRNSSDSYSYYDDDRYDDDRYDDKYDDDDDFDDGFDNFC
ncbi:MAG: hypothetical protein UD936_05465 [Acutalibacteraceae bacterium]|nr:hypothetical protein [Acutalibacteraceae bacterium]